jgi:hypothetical protein
MKYRGCINGGKDGLREATLESGKDGLHKMHYGWA